MATYYSPAMPDRENKMEDGKSIRFPAPVWGTSPWEQNDKPENTILKANGLLQRKRVGDEKAVGLTTTPYLARR